MRARNPCIGSKGSRTDTFRDATSIFAVGLAVKTNEDSAMDASKTIMQVDHMLDIPLTRA
jgi:hypothetical protein